MSKVPKVKVPSSGSIYFDFKAQEKDENQSVVCFSHSKRSALKEELSKRPFASFASVCKRASIGTGDDRIPANLTIIRKKWKVQIVHTLIYFIRDSPKTVCTILVCYREQPQHWEIFAAIFANSVCVLLLPTE